MKPESQYIARVHKCLDKRVHREKMHNRYRRGMADVWYSGPASDLWVEYKWMPVVRKQGFLNPSKLLEPLQLRWMLDRINEGRRVELFVGCPAGGLVFASGGIQMNYSVEYFVYRNPPEMAEWIEDLCLTGVRWP